MPHATWSHGCMGPQTMTYKYLHLLVQPVAKNEVVRHSQAVRLHGVVLPKVKVLKLGVIKICHALLALPRHSSCALGRKACTRVYKLVRHMLCVFNTWQSITGVRLRAVLRLSTQLNDCHSSCFQSAAWLFVLAAARYLSYMFNLLRAPRVARVACSSARFHVGSPCCSVQQSKSST